MTADLSGAFMLDGPSVVAALKRCGVTDIVWIPDSAIGTWEAAILAEPRIRLIRACREGEAIAIGAGLWLGGARPVVMMQCTGLFEAGDALRNAVHDLHVPLFLIVGIRGYIARQRGASSDNCPEFTEPIMRTWRIPYVLLDHQRSAEDLATEYLNSVAEKRAGAVLIPE
jgi:sulfopyruvate decarboxylase TPP-binding subunit